jgi:mannitol/fructose-specific phosphotransferase system IIA component (Ntr-type)
MEIEDIGLPCVIVNPLLSDTDLERIHQAVNSITSTPELSEPTNEINIYQSLHASAILSESILNLVDQIEVIQLSSDITRKGIIEKVSHYLGHDSESRKQIQKDILQREAMGSVVMDEENFALYHAQTNAVRLPRMLVFRPNKEVFNAYDSKTVHLIVALLIPENSFRELNYWMSHLSSALIEDDAYRLAVFSEDKTVIQKEVLRILKGPIKDWYRKVGG